jgi:peroxiredoxin (alkyl hydroperoxide reductase subunit C)
MLAFHQVQKVLSDLGVGLVGCSTNGPETHQAWQQTPKERGGLGTVLSYPVLSDVSRELSQRFDVLIRGRNVATRGLFVIDRDYRIVYEQRSDTRTARDTSHLIGLIREIRRVTKTLLKRDRSSSDTIM